MISKKWNFLKTKMGLVGLMVMALILGLTGCGGSRSHESDQKLLSSFQTNRKELSQLIEMIQADGLKLSNGEKGEKLVLFIYDSEVSMISDNLSAERIEQYGTLSKKLGLEWILVTYDQKGLVSNVDLMVSVIFSDQEPGRAERFRLDTVKGFRWSAGRNLKVTDDELPTQHRSLSNLNQEEIKRRENVRVEQNRQLENNWYLHFQSEDKYINHKA